MAARLGDATACLLLADVDECVGEEYCAPRGECLNSHGSFFCLCAPGFASTEGGTSCQGEKPAWPCPLASSRDIQRSRGWEAERRQGARRQEGAQSVPAGPLRNAYDRQVPSEPFEWHPSALHRAPIPGLLPAVWPLASSSGLFLRSASPQLPSGSPPGCFGPLGHVAGSADGGLCSRCGRMCRHRPVSRRTLCQHRRLLQLPV